MSRGSNCFARRKSCAGLFVLPILEGLNTLIEYGLRLKLLAGLRRSLLRENGWEVHLHSGNNNNTRTDLVLRRHDTDKAEFVHEWLPFVSAGA